jgi:hypothetical protein
LAFVELAIVLGYGPLAVLVVSRQPQPGALVPAVLRHLRGGARVRARTLVATA